MNRQISSAKSLPPDKVAYSIQVRQDQDAIVIILSASARRPAFPFELFCDQILVSSYHPELGSEVDGLELRFALPQDLLVNERRLLTLVPNDAGFPMLEAVCDITAFEIHRHLKVAIVDCSLRAASGHMFNTVNRLVKAFDSFAGKTQIFAHADFRLGVFDTAWYPVFQHSCYDIRDDGMLPVSENGVRDFQAKMALVDAMAGELIALTQRLADHHIVIFPTVTPLMFLAIAKWTSGKPDNGSHVIFGLMLESGAICIAPSRYVLPYPALLVSAGMQLLSKRTARDYHLWCVSEQLKKGYDKLAEPFPSVSVERSPNFFLDAREGASERPSKRHILLFVGEAKNDKGFRLLPGLLRAIGCSPEFKPHAFVVHHVGEEEPDAVLVVAGLIRELQSKGFDIQELRGYLDEASYGQLISSSKLILLRYDRAHYFEKSSGIAWEALGRGVSIVTYRGSFMAAEAAKFGLPSYLCESDDPFEVLNAFEAALSREDVDEMLCASAAASFRHENCAEHFAAMAAGLVWRRDAE